ncbi:radical SAM-linked protein [Lachnospiraceae bacterium PM6-15]|uniref:TIGR03936 family radical SAM-associated protein n=1 Tax=Ohessyouella blattaphilus TaxID=2949333 RepID=A0ABT1EEX3_9FIRM|nr:TIGR03936 family radical SAM-associated protein [Ohessyouella blattaphilus]MCP1109253.1 TIGR03936 family radical SAM-associated protein [Ohessyouella blattaphilus]MCR8562647.1 TIGR03936 family radical SAM-associated protein [Ohessyouella blattaphilus]
MLKVRLKFSKNGVMRYIGHLDLMRYFQKAMRRANVPVALSGGYSPHMIMSFALPLSVGQTADGDYMDIALSEEIDFHQTIADLNQVMVEGIEVQDIVPVSDDRRQGGMAIVAAASYLVSFKETQEIPADWSEKCQSFMAEDEIRIVKKTKRSEKEVNIRPFIFEMRVEEGGIYLLLAAGSSANLKPDLVLKAFLDYVGAAVDTPMHFHRLDLYYREADEFRALGDVKDDRKRSLS